jgi:hypothetical protein
MAKNIERLDAAKIYMTAELSKIFSAEKIQDELTKELGVLSEKELWRFLEALSFTYRMNEMFRYLSDSSFTWREEEVGCRKLTLTGMNPEVDKVTHGSIVRNDPLKFRDYLLDYFKNHPNNDPEGLGQFRPSGKPIQYPTIFLREENGKLNLLDGSNRLVATLLQGGLKINAIIGMRTSDGKPRVGDSTFWLLRHLYEQGDVNEKRSVISITKQLIQTSSDGKDAIKEYWIRHAPEDSEIRKIGESLIAQQQP